MKWFLFALSVVALVVLLPTNRVSRGVQLSLWALLGFLAVQQGPLGAYLALISWAYWPGYVKGLEVAALDILAFGFLLRSWNARLPMMPNLVPMGLYLAVVIGGALTAPEPQAGFFYAWQLCRVFLVVLAVYRGAATDESVAPAVLNGMGLALIVALLSALWESVMGGHFQTGGAFGHQNMLGMVTHFVSLPFLMAVLAGASGPLAIFVAASGPVSALLTVSRATLGIMLIGYVSTFLLSVVRRWSGRKLVVAAASMLFVAALAPALIGSFQARLARDQAASQSQLEDERAVFERAAEMMLTDHPFGVGPNHYVRAANMDGYSDRAGVVPTPGSRAAHVHNAYWLAAAETGYIGLAAFLLLLFQPLLFAIRWGWQNRGDRRGDVLLGLGMALAAVYFHSMYEWLLLTFQVQYMLGVSMGLVAALAYQLKRDPLAKRSKKLVGGEVLGLGRS